MQDAPIARANYSNKHNTFAIMLNFTEILFRYDPYPIGFAKNVLEPKLYDALTREFPQLEQLKQAPNMGTNKFLLTEFSGEPYFALIRNSANWRKFHDYIKSREFIDTVLATLCAGNIDLGFNGARHVSDNHFDPKIKRLTEKVKRNFAARFLQPQGGVSGHLTSRFEFSALRGEAGSHRPHTDAPRKIVSLVLSMMRPGEWDPAWGGGTSVVRPLDQSRNFNHLNKYMGFDDVEVLETYPFIPNGCVLFVKTFNSWHAVMPYTAKVDVVRKSVVINIDYSHAVGAAG